MYTIEHFTFDMRILEADFFSLVTWALYPRYITTHKRCGITLCLKADVERKEQENVVAHRNAENFNEHRYRITLMS